MKLIFTFLIVIICVSINAQNKIKQFEHYNISDKKDNIDFIVLRKNKDIKKPTLLFCQGSMPVPLFLKYNNDTINLQLSNFDLDYMSEEYNLVVVSRPFTPIIVDTSEINSAYNYVTDKYNNPNSYDTSYLKSDTKEITTRRVNKVWKFLKKQKWVDKSEFIIAGHSQGSREAVEIASNNKEVTKIGLFSYSPDGRYQETLKRNRKRAEAGKISWEEADSLNLDWLEYYKNTLVDYEKLDRLFSYSWKSFNEPSLPKLLKLKIPIYIVYGSNDIGAVNCDFLPFYFAKANKENLTIKRYGGLEHNFFETNENRVPNYDKPHWIEVMNQFIDWTLKNGSH